MVVTERPSDPSMPLRLTGACVLVVAFAGGLSCATSREFGLSPGETTLEGDGGALDVQWTDDLAFVETRVNGSGPLHFLLDTGASVVVVTPAAADALGLDRLPIHPESDGVELRAAHATTVRVREVAPIRELRAGPLTLRDVDAHIVDSGLLALVMGRPFDGVLPATAFRGLLLTMDFPGRSVTLGRGALPPAGEGAAGAHVVPLVPGTDPQLPHVSIRADASMEPFRVLLDTGSDEFLAVPRGLALRFRSGPAEAGRTVSAGGAALPTRRGRIDGTVTWAGHALADPVVALAPDGHGSAGVALLRNFRLTLDLAHDRVRFERESAEPIRCPSVRGIGAGMVRRPGSWTVGYVMDGSPAARAGLAVGDRVEAVAGIPVAELSGEIFDVLLATEASIRLRVSGAVGTREFDVPVATFVE